MGWWSDLWDTIFPHGGGNTRKSIRANDRNSKKETEEKTKKESDK